jgi:hypothetical protein
MSPEKPTPASQLAKLDALISAAAAARADAIKGIDIFGTVRGLALTNAVYDLLEIDAVYDWGEDLRRELGLFEEIEPLPRVTTKVRKLDPAIWPGLEAAE